MLYQKSFRLFWASIAMLSIARVFLKVMDIDMVTGFYSTASIAGNIFNAVLLLAAILLIVVTLGVREKASFKFKGGRSVEATSAMSGAVVALISFLQLLTAKHMPEQQLLVNALSRRTLLIISAMGIAAGVSMVVLSLFLLSGSSQARFIAMLALFPPLWHSFWTVVRFMSFRCVTTASDQLMETIFMTSMSMFLLYHARALSDVRPHRKRCVALGLLSALFGLPLAMGQLAVGFEGMGPPLVQVLLIFALSIYAVAFSRFYAKAKDTI